MSESGLCRDVQVDGIIILLTSGILQVTSYSMNPVFAVNFKMTGDAGIRSLVTRGILNPITSPNR